MSARMGSAPCAARGRYESESEDSGDRGEDESARGQRDDEGASLLDGGDHLRAKHGHHEVAGGVRDGTARFLTQQAGEDRQHVATRRDPERQPSENGADDGNQSRRQDACGRAGWNQTDGSVASRHVPGDEYRYLRHHAISEADPGRKERNFRQRANDGFGFLQPSPAVRTVANMLPERLNAKSAFPVNEEIDFVR
jgi:hypothetical protein